MADHEDKSAGRLVHILGVCAVLACLILICLLLMLRHRSVSKEQQSRQADIRAGAHVQVAIVAPAPKERTITLTGEARPYASVTLYAKVSGYLKQIKVDKGDRVKQGQLLALIASPELESQYQAAHADARNKRVFANRELALVKDGIISQQEADDALTAARTAEANSAALKSQLGYLQVRAPFAGVVTARFADPGALMQSAATGQTQALPVVTLSTSDRLRIYLYLDQKSAGQVRLGDRAVVTDSARPESRFPAQVSRISGELDPKSRTMLCELDLDNTSGKIPAGGFVQVALTLAAPPYLQIPASAVYSQGEQSLVAVIGNDNRVSFRKVTIAESDGKLLKLSGGVQQGERVALTPGTGLTEGELVQPVAEAGAPAGAGAGATGSQGKPATPGTR
jgi:membrane fusion protein, multidrug efflux system